jgi:hypothetical protein
MNAFDCRVLPHLWSEGFTVTDYVVVHGSSASAVRGGERIMPLFILAVFLIVDLWLGIVGFLAFMPGATGTNRAAFALWLLLSAPIALGLATDWRLERRLGRAKES